MDFHNSIAKRYFLSIVLLACTLVCHPTDAKTLTVGGSLGWTNFDSATSASPDYSTWVSSQKVNVGDVLVFNYAVNFHDVYLLPTKAAFDACTVTTGKSVAPASAGTYSWTAPSVGLFYFACSFGAEGSSHCQAGQKLAVNVAGPAAVSPPVISPDIAPSVIIPPPRADVPVAAPIRVPVTSPVPIIVPIPTPIPAPAAPVVPPNVTAPAPAPVARANVSAPVPAPATGGATNATNVSSPAPAPVIVVPAPVPVVVPVPTPVPAAPKIPVPVPAPTVVRAPVPAPRHAPRPAPHHAPRPAPKHAPHPSPKHSPHHAPAPAPYLGPPAPPLPPSSPDVYTPDIAPATESDESHAGLTSPLEWRSLVLVICLMTAFLVL